MPDLLLYDPKGLTSVEFTRLGIRYRKIDRVPKVVSRMKLVVGRNCLTRELLDELFETDMFDKEYGNMHLILHSKKD